jgi:hypothetical protein
LDLIKIYVTKRVQHAVAMSQRQDGALLSGGTALSLAGDVWQVASVNK